MPKAAGLADEIKSEFGVESEFVPGRGGVFDVVANGMVIFSKHKVGRFPEHEEIITALKALS